MPIKPERLKEAARRLREEANAASGSVEEYIKKKLEAARAAALEKSRMRAMPAFVAERDPSNLKIAAERATRDAETALKRADAYANAGSISEAHRMTDYDEGFNADPFFDYDRSSREHARLQELRAAARYSKMAEEIESGKSSAPAFGGNCIATATDNYGKQYVVVSNRDFYGDPERYGFMQIPNTEAKPGDVVQHGLEQLDGTLDPTHGMVLNSVDENGVGRFNYSRGSYDPNALVRDGRFGGQSRLIVDYPNGYRSFRFVGTPADSTRWRQEFESGQFGCGGKKYPEGGEMETGKYPTSTTSAYLRGLADYVLKRKTPKSFVESEYRPTIGDDGEKYYTRPGLKNEVALNLFGGTDYGSGLLGQNYFYNDFDDAYKKIAGTSTNRDMRASSNGTLGQYSVTTGEDERGRYLSFVDKFDHVFIPGKPIHIYDRIYEDEAPALYNSNDSAINLGDALSRSPLLKNMKSSSENNYPDGGKFFRTNLQNESPLMYQPMMPINYPIVTPLGFRPQPDLGDYQAPASTGMMVDYPINLPSRTPVVVQDSISAPVVVEVPAENLFSDEMIARRALKQRYAESAFNDKAKSKAGAQGAWQIMPITLKDYLGRGRGKAGDLNDPEYNRKVRDWVMGIIPRDLKEFWSESDSDRAKLAKLYAAYNWGAGNLRSFLRKKRDAGIDISNPDNWVDDLNPETRRYVKYLAFDEDIPDSTVYTNAAFEKAAAERGYANGGNLFETGGPSSGMNPLTNLFHAAKEKYLTDYANSGQMYGYPYYFPDLVQNYILSPYNYKNKYKVYSDKSRDDAIDEYINGSSQRRALFSKYYGLDNTNFKPDDYIIESRYRPSKSTNPDAKYYTYKIDDVFDRSQSFLDNNGKVKIDFGNDENGNYISIYDVWDLAPFGSRVGNQMGGAPIEMYDRFYESENPRVYYRLKGMASEDEYASGGKIHIKPENHGKFTALKKRTGHSASWFKAHGTPAQKKMAVFALNSKKWKHGDGGPIDRYSPGQIRAAIAKLKETKK